MFPVRYNLGLYIAEDGILLIRYEDFMAVTMRVGLGNRD
jgi:hypothetical protein